MSVRAPSSAMCTGPDCRRAARAGGLCFGHYQQRRRGRDLVPLRGAHGKVSADESFRCERWGTFLTFRACVARHTVQKTTRSRWGRHLRLVFPDCAACPVGRKVAKRFPELVKVPPRIPAPRRAA